jgi:hypothetical protein
MVPALDGDATAHGPAAGVHGLVADGAGDLAAAVAVDLDVFNLVVTVVDFAAVAKDDLGLLVFGVLEAAGAGAGDGRDLQAVLGVDTPAVASLVVDGAFAAFSHNLDVGGGGVAVVQAEALSHVLIVGVGFGSGLVLGDVLAELFVCAAEFVIFSRIDCRKLFAGM